MLKRKSIITPVTDLSVTPLHSAEGLAEPSLRAVFKYWDEARTKRPMPSRSDIRPADIVRYLPVISLADVVDGGRDFRLRLLGTRIDEVLGGFYTGSLVSSFPQEEARYGLFSCLLPPTRERRPYVSRGSLLPTSPDYIRFTSVMLPLSSDGANVDMLLICSQFEPRRSL